jgi:hypothetical protein
MVLGDPDPAAGVVEPARDLEGPGPGGALGDVAPGLLKTRGAQNTTVSGLFKDVLGPALATARHEGLGGSVAIRHLSAMPQVASRQPC